MSHCFENGSEQGLGRLALLASGDRVLENVYIAHGLNGCSLIRNVRSRKHMYEERVKDK